MASVFTQWAKNKLHGYLEPMQAAAAPAAQMVAQPGATDRSLLAQMTTVMAKLAEGQGELQLQGKQSRAEGMKALDDYDTAALKGWYGVNDLGKVPVFWALRATSKSLEAARSNLLREMQQWSKTTGHEIYKSIHFTDEQMKDFTKNKPNPTMGLATLATADRGVSNLVCLSKPHAEIEEQIIREELAAETAENRTLEEALKLAKSRTVKPPDSYFHFCLMVNTNSALLFAMYWKYCPCYENMLHIANGLRMPCCKLNTKLFRKAFCHKATWAIFEGQRRFFAQRLMPQDFMTDQIAYPQCLLGFISLQIMNQEEIFRATFPPSWEVKREEKAEQQSSGAGSGAGGGGGGYNRDRSNGRGGDRYEHRDRVEQDRYNWRYEQGGGDRDDGELSHLHRAGRRR